MANEPVQGLPYPDLTGVPPNVPADIKALADAVAPRTVMRFASIAARDAALPAPVDGMVCFVAADSGYYVRVDGEWRVLWQDTGWVGVTPAAGLSPLLTGAAVRRIGRVVYYRGGLSGVSLSTSGTVVGTVAAEFRPVTSVDGSVSAVGLGSGAVARATVSSSGAITIIAPTNQTSSVYLKGLSGYLVD